MGYSKAITRHHLEDTLNSPGEVSQPQNWVPPVLKTVASQFEGIEHLTDAVLSHADYLRQSGQWHAKDRAAIRANIRRQLIVELLNDFRQNVPAEVVDSLVEQAQNRLISPNEAVRELLAYNRINTLKSSE